MVRAARLLRLAQRAKTLAHVFAKELWLLPCGKVRACFEFVVMDQLGIRAFCPAARAGIDLFGARGNDRGDRHVFGSKKRELVLPIKTGRRDARIR
jgi:hypothetical protein